MIEHVFVLMLENRSFDHMLGFSGLQGPDPSTGQATDPGEVSEQSLEETLVAFCTSPCFAMLTWRPSRVPIC